LSWDGARPFLERRTACWVKVPGWSVFTRRRKAMRTPTLIASCARWNGIPRCARRTTSVHTSGPACPCSCAISWRRSGAGDPPKRTAPPPLWILLHPAASRSKHPAIPDAVTCLTASRHGHTIDAVPFGQFLALFLAQESFDEKLARVPQD